jgi:lysophospholipase L1-like esterase
MMCFRPYLRLFIQILILLCFASVVLAEEQTISGESVVLAAQLPAKLIFNSLVSGSLVIRSTYKSGQSGTIIYTEGTDYVVDYELGLIWRTSSSRIPDYANNSLYGKRSFDHVTDTIEANTAYFVYCDYHTTNPTKLTETTNQSDQLKRARTKLQAGGDFTLLAYGDSICAGGEASTAALRFTDMYASYLQANFPNANVTLLNQATGGDRSTEGLSRLATKVLNTSPDLVLLGFGMNDHNTDIGIPVAQFKSNMTQMVQSIQSNLQCDIILFSAFPPDPNWKYSSHSMAKYAQATREVAVANGCAYADVFGVWMRALDRSNHQSLINNHINHPNDFGHQLYFEALKAVEFFSPAGEQLFEDPFDATPLSGHWNKSGAVSKATESGVIPSADGHVLQMDGTACIVNKDVSWASGTVTAYVKHTANSSMQGVLACAPGNLTTTHSAPFFLASYLGSGNYLRLWVSNGAAFPGIAISNIDYTLPSAPDNQYHKLSLTVNRNTAANPLCVISWDGTPVTQWNESGGFWESTSTVPSGHPGIFTYFAGTGTITKFDTFSTRYLGQAPEATFSSNKRTAFLYK